MKLQVFLQRLVCQEPDRGFWRFTNLASEDQALHRLLQRKPKADSRERALLEKVHLNAAEMDIGADTHWAVVPVDRNENTAWLGSCTSDIQPEL